jgi:hypothetical protein
MEKNIKIEAIWLNYFYEHYAGIDDLAYIVPMDGHVYPIRVSKQSKLDNVNWKETCILNKLCSGNTMATTTICKKNPDDDWVVDKRGSWRVYGSPFQMTPAHYREDHFGMPFQTHDDSQRDPVSVYPQIQYNLYDMKEELDIVLSQGTLLCIELFEVDLTDTDAKTYLIPKHALFQPASSQEKVLFQGSITFEALANCWLDKKPTILTMPVSILMNGPNGNGQARILVWAERRRSIVDKVTHQLPSQLILRLVNLAIPIHDHIDRYNGLLEK